MLLYVVPPPVGLGWFNVRVWKLRRLAQRSRCVPPRNPSRPLLRSSVHRGIPPPNWGKLTSGPGDTVMGDPAGDHVGGLIGARGGSRDASGDAGAELGARLGTPGPIEGHLERRGRKPAPGDAPRDANPYLHFWKRWQTTRPRSFHMWTLTRTISAGTPAFQQK